MVVQELKKKFQELTFAVKKRNRQIQIYVLSCQITIFN
jgi:hypothetical protein